MVAGLISEVTGSSADANPAIAELSSSECDRLLHGQILLDTQPHTNWGAAVTARLHIALPHPEVWQQITDYSRWVSFFPDLTCSEVLLERSDRRWKRIYQVATKNFLILQASADIQLKVFEHRLWEHQSLIQFRLEHGSFNDFSADLRLDTFRQGTLLTYHVKATPAIPVPSMIIQQAIRMDLPANLEQMRRVLTQESV